MPYIEEDERVAVQEHGIGTDSLPGHLAYAVTMMCKAYLGKQPRFFRFAAVIGVLVCVVLELYRRVVAPYEDEKRHENGDVF